MVQIVNSLVNTWTVSLQYDFLKGSVHQLFIYPGYQVNHAG